MAWRPIAGNAGYDLPLTYCEHCSHFDPEIDTDRCIQDMDDIDYHVIKCSHAEACNYIFYCVKESYTRKGED